MLQVHLPVGYRTVVLDIDARSYTSNRRTKLATAMSGASNYAARFNGVTGVRVLDLASELNGVPTIEFTGTLGGLNALMRDYFADDEACMLQFKI